MDRRARIETFDSLLVANRGEIAVRIMRSARALGLRTIAVYSDADAGAPHVRAADTAIRIGPARASESYLSIPALMDAVDVTAATAIHPGYGFLSERAEFADAVRRAGRVYVGPPTAAIDLLGRKDRAHELARSVGVRVLPSVDVESTASAADVVAAVAAAGLRFPLLVKAAAGGGGKGMRVVTRSEDLLAALDAGRREAIAGFADGALLLEPFVTGGRHIEVQILADDHGNVLHLGERDCSSQRRHQKVIEETPAPGLAPRVRDEVTSGALALARGAGYSSAGTVEFLIDDDGVAHFLEMNTRLQVEHAVTELVTGIDLVEAQLLIADGQPLAFGQADVRFEGHAIEARIYAEDAFAGFVPQAGTVDLVRWPSRTPAGGVRLDTALEAGQVVGTDYDPMLGKIIVHAADREQARRDLVAAIDDTAIIGVTTNLGFVRAVLETRLFREGGVRTSWLDTDEAPRAPSGRATAAAIAAWAWVRGRTSAADRAHPFGCGDGWRVAGPPAPIVVGWGDDGEVGVDPDGSITVPGGAHHVRGRVVRSIDVGQGHGPAGLVAAVEVDAQMRTGVVVLRRHSADVAFRGHTFTFAPIDRLDPRRHARIDGGDVTAPMPGVLVEVAAVVGDRVEEGEQLGVLEAMKMQVPLRAPFAGLVEVAADPSRSVARDDLLFRVVPDDADGRAG